MANKEKDAIIAELNNHAVSLIDSGRYADAEGLLTKALSLDPARSGLLFNRAEAHRLAGNLEAAQHDLETALSLEPHSAEILHALGLLYYERDDFAQARVYYDRALTENPHYAAAWNDLGVVEFRSGNFERARDCFERAVGIEPDCADAWFNLADTYDELGLADRRAWALTRLREARMRNGDKSGPEEEMEEDE